MKHTRQASWYGCQNHAIYAITEEPEALRDPEDMNPQRLDARMAEAGWLRVTYYSDLYLLRPCGREWWEMLRRRTLEGGADPEAVMQLVVTHRSILNPNYLHAVAVQIPLTGNGDVFVADSNRSDMACYSWERFLSLPYSEAYDVALYSRLSMAELEFQRVEATPENAALKV